MRSARLEIPFADLYGAELMRLPLTGSADALAYDVALLGPAYEEAAKTKGPDIPDRSFASSIARGTPDAPGRDTIQTAIARGFGTTPPPDDIATLLDEARLGEAILNADALGAISFTGSVETGKHVAATCAGRLAKVQLEMGGKNPFVVLDDADLNVAVNCAVNSAFFSTGQRCTASSRLIVTEGIHDKFVQAMSDRIDTLKVDDALADGTEIGPVVDESQLKQDLDYIEIGRKEGAKLVGGDRLKLSKDGYYMKPALFTETTNDMRINREEIFGPVASVIRVKDYDEALTVANDTSFGLSSGIATTSLKYASDYKRNAEAGMVMVNLPTAGVDYHVPFGGRKGSSYGPREQGRYAAEFYTTVKTAYTQP
jgi:aldehyde dehydrogenase (NAD+)